MDISYCGHSCFKLRGKTGTVVTDPYSPKVGLALPSVSADIITVSHHHFDHDAVDRVKGTVRRPQPFVIDAPGEYELNEISITGIPSYHDNRKGVDRGKNTIMLFIIDGVRIVHLGDLGHTLGSHKIERLGSVDGLFIPIGGIFTIGLKQAAEIARKIEPSYLVPMHYRTAAHSQDFNKTNDVNDFLKEMGQNGIEPKDKLTISPGSLPEEMEVVVLSDGQS